MGKAEKTAAGMSDHDAHFIKQLRDRFSIHPGNQSPAVRSFLRRAEESGILNNPSFDNYYMTPLGLAVRAILQEQSK